MPINNEKKTCFIAIPKTGATSISLMLNIGKINYGYHNLWYPYIYYGWRNKTVIPPYYPTNI